MLKLPPASVPLPGCDSVDIRVHPGLQDVAGAAFMLNISLNAKAGLLLPTGDNAVPAFFLGRRGHCWEAEGLVQCT